MKEKILNFIGEYIKEKCSGPELNPCALSYLYSYFFNNNHNSWEKAAEFAENAEGKGIFFIKQKLEQELKVNISGTLTMQKYIKYRGVEKAVEELNKPFKKFNDKKNSVLQENKDNAKKGKQGEKIKVFFNNSFKDFFEWYREKARDDVKCCYCGVTEETLEKYFTDTFLDKLGRKRGKKLEFERIYPKGKYDKNNCEFTCYICNNAKSDFISAKNFEEIACGINTFWNTLLKQKGIKIEFNTEEYRKKFADKDEPKISL